MGTEKYYDPNLPHHNYKSCCRHFSWSAVFVGALVALGLGFLTYLLAMSAAFYFHKSDQQTLFIMTTIGIGLLAILTYLSTIISGWVAGGLVRANGVVPQTRLGILHGFVAWSLAIALGLGVLAHTHRMPMHSFLMTSAISYSIEDRTNNPRTSVTTPMLDTRTLSQITFTMFCLALLGVISSCLGGACGIKQGIEHDDELTVVRKTDINAP